MTSFQTYLLGFIIVIAGLAAAAFMLGAEPVWIVIGAVVLVGIGILSATTRTRPRDPRQPDDAGQPRETGTRQPY